MLDTIGKRIARLRQEAGMSQAQLARRLHISRSSVQAWESGHSYPSTDKLVALSRQLHVSTDYLLDCENDHNICLDHYSPSEQAIILRLLQYFDEHPDVSDKRTEEIKEEIKTET